MRRKNFSFRFTAKPTGEDRGNKAKVVPCANCHVTFLRLQPENVMQKRDNERRSPIRLAFYGGEGALSWTALAVI